MGGKLWVVPTPIGNLEDITLRALRLLGEVEVIFSEDTRTTRHLLQHHGISTPLRAYHQHNEHAQLVQLVAMLEGGVHAALTSDAGTPGISDPGFLLIRECIARGVEVECLPGATALVPAVVMSGFPSDRFVYEGFLPLKKGRQKRLEQIAEEKRTVVLYESPHRILRLLEELRQHVGANRRIALLREMTKLYATAHRGTVQELLDFFQSTPPRGEFVVVIDQSGKLIRNDDTASPECED